MSEDLSVCPKCGARETTNDEGTRILSLNETTRPLRCYACWAVVDAETGEVLSETATCKVNQLHNQIEELKAENETLQTMLVFAAEQMEDCPSLVERPESKSICRDNHGKKDCVKCWIYAWRQRAHKESNND